MASVQQQHLDKADSVRNRHERRNATVRSRPELTHEAKQSLIAASYLKARTEMSDVEQTATFDTAAQKSAAERSAFGTDDIEGDRASLAVSMRDAQDRAAQLTNPKDAAALLARAERSSDEPLARAIASHAYDHHVANIGLGDPGWATVVDDYLTGRPAQTKAVQKLMALDSGAEGAGSMRQTFAFVLPKPPELQTVPKYQIMSLASKSAGMGGSSDYQLR